VGERQARVPPEDLDDVRHCLGGDGDAYRRLIERHQKQVSAMMWRFSRDPEVHEELVQDVFVQAYESLANYRARAPFAHWLARIATRVGYAHWKRQKREKAIETVPLEDWHHIPEEPPAEMEPAEAGELLHKLLAELPPRDRLVLTLRYVEDHSVEKTAELTGWSQTMVKVQAWRARKKLQALFEKADEGADR
jgi:RNA polymerase sigma-70 factor (ECF subfamily)